eukprot:6068530-Pleurochrysis_carterae.AAC.1
MSAALAAEPTKREAAAPAVGRGPSQHLCGEGAETANNSAEASWGCRAVLDRIGARGWATLRMWRTSGSGGGCSDQGRRR